ncbi:MAG: class IV adenylate cyclase [Candidatus Sulfotelmatobacter sp.]
MPTNIEIKAVLTNRAATEAATARLSDSGPETIHQEDFFFCSDRARLKLRVFASDRGELIRYERTNVADARGSHYLIARTSDPQKLLEILRAELGAAGVVKKTRTLYLIGQTRVHIDEVSGLGEFLELEVVLRPEQTEAEGKKIANSLLAELGIGKEQLLAEAYVDLLARKSSYAGPQKAAALPIADRDSNG